jgi:hypothetical protein
VRIEDGYSVSAAEATFASCDTPRYPPPWQALLRSAEMKNGPGHTRPCGAFFRRERLVLACAVERRRFPVGASPTRQLY